MKWIEALKQWNTEHNKGKWCVPKKGSPEHAAVMKIVGSGGKKIEAAPAAKSVTPKMETQKPKKNLAAMERLKKSKMIREKLKDISAREVLKRAIKKRLEKKEEEKEQLYQDYYTSHEIEGELKEMVENYIKKNIDIDDEDFDDYFNLHYTDLLQDLGDYDDVTNEIVKVLRKRRFTDKQLVGGMRYLSENEGYTMFDDFIEEHL